MTKLLERAVDSVRALPSEVQDELARLLLQVAGEEQPVIVLTPEERADLAEADAEISWGSSPQKNRYAQFFQSAPCEVARYKARGDADRKRARLHSSGFPARGEPRPGANASSFPTVNSAPLRGAVDRPSWRAAPHSRPHPYLIFYRITDSEVIIQRVRHTSRRSRSASGRP